MSSVSPVPVVRSGATWLYRAGGNPFLVSKKWMTGSVENMGWVSSRLVRTGNRRASQASA